MLVWTRNASQFSVERRMEKSSDVTAAKCRHSTSQFPLLTVSPLSLPSVSSALRSSALITNTDEAER